MSFERGQTVTASTTVTNAAGTPVNTPTVVLTVTAPNGTVTTPAITNTAAGGVYTAPVPVPDLAASDGIWLLAWVASGTVSAAHVDQFEVRSTVARILSLADAKVQLNITTTDQDLELADYIDSVTDVIENITGPMVTRTITETIFVSGDTMVLSYPPVISITSITAPQLGTTVPLVADLNLEPSTGIVYRLIGGYLGGSWVSRGRLTVTYLAGRSPVPASVNLAARIILQHLWTTQHNPAVRPAQFGDAQPQPGMAYALPNRALELLEPYRRAPAVA